MVTDILSKLFQAQIITHYWHLRTSSYAEHMALGGFYDSLTGLLDKLAEAFIGKYKKLPEIPKSISLDKDNPVQYMQELADFLDVYIQGASPDCQDILIDIKNLVNKTKYLLTLK